MCEGSRAAKNNELKEQEEDGRVGLCRWAGGGPREPRNPCHRPALPPGSREDRVLKQDSDMAIYPFPPIVS